MKTYDLLPIIIGKSPNFCAIFFGSLSKLASFFCVSVPNIFSRLTQESISALEKCNLKSSVFQKRFLPKVCKNEESIYSSFPVAIAKGGLPGGLISFLRIDLGRQIFKLIHSIDFLIPKLIILAGSLLISSVHTNTTY